MSVNLVDWLGDNAWAWWLTAVLMFGSVGILTRSRWAHVLAAAALVASGSGAVAMLGDRGVEIAVPAVTFLVAASALVWWAKPWNGQAESPINVPDDDLDDVAPAPPRRAL